MNFGFEKGTTNGGQGRMEMDGWLLPVAFAVTCEAGRQRERA